MEEVAEEGGRGQGMHVGSRNEKLVTSVGHMKEEGKRQSWHEKHSNQGQGKIVW